MHSIGKMRHVLKIQKQVNMPDGGGGFRKTWVVDEAIEPLWCRIRPVSYNINDMDDGIRTKMRYEIIVRYHAEIKAGMRLYDESETRIFEILTVENPDQRKEFLYLQAIKKITD